MHFAYFSEFLIESPGSELSAAKRRKPRHQVFWVDYELPGGEEHPQAMLFVLVRFSGFACSGLLWYGGKGILTTFGRKGRD